MASLNAGTRLGPYEIQSPLGAGGMGEVYRARDTRLDRVVAIKVLASELAEDPAIRERFELEARAISSLNHPNICVLYDVGRAAELSPRTFCIFLSELSSLQRTVSVGRTPGGVLEELRGVRERPMIIPHDDDHGPPSAALRPPASRSRPTHRGRDHRDGSRGPSLDGPWVAWRGTEGRGEPGRDGPESLGTSARSLGAPPTRQEAHSTPSTRARPAAKLRN